MIQVIAGRKGSGKTKRIIDMANKASQDSKHDIVFIDDDNRYMFDLRHEVRFINASEYDLTNDQMFIGFLTGVVAQNFDVGLILIDAFMKLIKQDLANTESFFNGWKPSARSTAWISCSPSARRRTSCRPSSKNT